MKISTDSILLGSWALVSENYKSILDIGTGTGIISLMLAQRINDCKIDAIEIDKDSFDECSDNFKNSSWENRLNSYHCGWKEFVRKNFDKKYDLIISNPPFYSEDLPINYSSKHLAKFSTSLPFDELLSGVSKLLINSGVFFVIVPSQEKSKFIEIASFHKLFPFKITDVKGNRNTEFKRSLLSFSKEKLSCQIDELIIEIDRNSYTKEYINLTKDFYLHF